MNEYVYHANATLNDGSEVVVDLEQRGWADKEMLARTVRWSLVPKGTGISLNGRPYPLISIAIPEGAKPVFRSRVYTGSIVRRSSDQIERKVIPTLRVPQFRTYCIGWKKGRTTVWTWVLPTGDIEVSTGDDSYLGGQIRSQLNLLVDEIPEPEPPVEATSLTSPRLNGE